ncbi:hypothetical protein SAMN05421823_108251 [Catalinimonas alkaloidigena]|uniref:Uncharacterized protein n=1 Tax=Catalinimonas alkaloidigena TaxID=1075417 RepID=A0A1G9NE96_9BACT|nr:hypothetical protein [Catalinimonas alkaloidigena]SDL84245.1 hypothetical protein SAMN05421823_108251 [Catalinimonas alkaloidigena]
MKLFRFWVFFLFVGSGLSWGQSTEVYRLRLALPLYDFPQNRDLPYRMPSMQQAAQLSSDVYDLSYWGIDGLSNLVLPVSDHTTGGRKLLNGSLKYLMSLGLVRYGSELPLPLGVWAHEEFHRAVLGMNGASPKNGNWLFTRWDGTVFGVSDAQLTVLKRDHLPDLLYAYVAGLQAESYLTQYNLVRDVHEPRTIYKNALYLYNAYYGWNYFRFSTSAASDSVKVLAPPHEAAQDVNRDFAGADLTAWAYDLFGPDRPYTERDPFPNGEGVNRRVGFQDLSPEAQHYLEAQKKLSLINFLNPAIFGVNRIRFGERFSFLVFPQYVPTHFGHAISLFVPLRTVRYKLLAAVHTFRNQHHTYPGVEVDLFDYVPADSRWLLSGSAQGWQQPGRQGFFDTEGKWGGALALTAGYQVGSHWALAATLTSKTAGWQMANPFLTANTSARLEVRYQLARQH